MRREMQPGYRATRAQTVSAKTIDADARTVELAFSSEAPYERSWGVEILDHSPESIRLDRLQSGGALLVEHDARDQVGVIEAVRVDGDRVARAVVRFGRSARATEVWQDVQDGIRRNVSVGYAIHKAVEEKRSGKPEAYRVTEWEPHEISIVSIPADTTVGVGRSVEPADQSRDETRAIEKEPKMDKEQTAPPQAPAAVEAATENRAAQSAPVPPQDKAPQVDFTARAAEIVDLATKHGMADRAAEWIRSAKPIDAIRSEILDALAAKDAQSGGTRNMGHVHAGADQRDKIRGAIMQALLARGRVPDASDRTGQKIVQIDHGNEYRGATLLDIARRCLDVAGVRHWGMDPREVVRQAFTQGTSDFPIILENTMHKSLTAGYAITQDTWSRFCATGTVTDFREHNRYTLGALPNLLARNEHGEYQNVAIPDGEKATIAAATKGFLVNLTREAIINDDMGALVGIPTMMGRSAARTIEADVYAYLATNPTVKGSALFTDARKNLVASGGTSPLNSPSAPTVAAFQVMRQAMAAQRDITGHDILNLSPAIFLGSLAYGVEARVVNEAQFDPTTGTKDTRPNVSRGMVRDIVESARITNNNWYLFADPNEVPTIEVAFLNGVNAPFLDSEEGFTSDGVRMKVRLDYGIRAVDWRGAIRNNGA